jgi:hypothetical protein
MGGCVALPQPKHHKHKDSDDGDKDKKKKKKDKKGKKGKGSPTTVNVAAAVGVLTCCPLGSCVSVLRRLCRGPCYLCSRLKLNLHCSHQRRRTRCLLACRTAILLTVAFRLPIQLRCRRQRVPRFRAPRQHLRTVRWHRILAPRRTRMPRRPCLVLLHSSTHHSPSLLSRTRHSCRRCSRGPLPTAATLCLNSPPCVAWVVDTPRPSLQTPLEA